MAQRDFRLELKYNASSQQLYEQFATQQGVRNWWTQFCEMEERVGGKASFRFPSSDFYAVVEILRLEPNRSVEWECIESKRPDNSGFADLHDWVGTGMRFDIVDLGGAKSQLNFTHVGLVPLECGTVCSSLWSFYLGQSLRGYLETGAGKPHTAN